MINKDFYINNAGLVLLHPFYTTLFEQLGLVSDNTFNSKEAQMNAVNYLHFVATGTTESEEQLLLLNKVLAGLAVDSPVSTSIDITEGERKLIDEMLTATVNHWSVLKNTSIEGFRETFLVRDGRLREAEDHWELVVEKKAYDVLMDQLPWAISIVKLPFMPKPIYVTW